ncbi:MAG: 30S ribosomal protein S17 [Candidatus Marinimicrobia bacterium]|mgnify:CR=1 FL=1|nr:30S ribosomal protein S17 [Candidatus Neomarinimicrobiota bacterium]|tara:strand:+ start:278 stop:553 length:276 start_codon:yes stop_codon:yes gene_type:complete
MSEIRQRQSLVGEVTSTKMEKTVVVNVTRKVKHPMYRKFVKRYKKYLAHTTSVIPKNGDIVKIVSIRPISKRKRWQVSEIVRSSMMLGDSE